MKAIVKNLRGLLSAALMTLAGTTCAFAVEVTSNSAESRIVKSSWFDTFAAGGWVMWPLLFCSLIVIGYAVERFLALREEAVLPHNLKERYFEALARVRHGEHKTKILRELVSFEGKTEGEKLFAKFLSRDIGSIRDSEQILQEYIDVTLYNLQQNVKPIGVIVTVSPLLGLFGTVVGIIQSFDAVAQQGFGRPEFLASGMAVALLTTVFGLAVAIPSSILHHYLSEMATRRALKMYEMLHDLLLAWNTGEADKKPSA